MLEKEIIHTVTISDTERGIKMNEQMIYSFNKLWHVLLDKGMTKRELAEKANISVASLGRLKQGKTLSYERMMRICKAVDCDITEIMDIKTEK